MEHTSSKFGELIDAYGLEAFMYTAQTKGVAKLI